MIDSHYRALVVDDEELVRQLAVRSLSAEGFRCDQAANGEIAAQMFLDTRYDVVLTDLRMPRRHGHSLAVELLSRPERPVIVVVTGVLEPRLAKDLLARGVDDIAFKPVDYEVLGAKVRTLVARKNAAASGGNASGEISGKSLVEEEDELDSPLAAAAGEGAATVPATGRLATILPISDAAIEVTQMTSSMRHDAAQIAGAIERDPSLATEVLRLANSSLYNPAGNPITDLEYAVTRIGQKHIGELALATSALASITPEQIPWIDLNLVWLRSMAAGIAMELLVRSGGHEQLEEGLHLAALTHALGRIALATMYPERYARMVKKCRQTREALRNCEQRMFSETHTEVMARLFEAWQIPPSVYKPLAHMGRSFSETVNLGEPLRTKVELAKLAALVGRIAVGQWESWDWLEFPPGEYLRRLEVVSLESIIQTTRTELESLRKSRGDAGKKKGHCSDKGQTKQKTKRRFGYINLDGQPFDFVSGVLPSMGVVPVKHAQADPVDVEGMVVNCLWTEPDKIVLPHGLQERDERVVILIDRRSQLLADKFSHTCTLPASYEALRAAVGFEA